jgi:hypothetical protein
LNRADLTNLFTRSPVLSMTFQTGRVFVALRKAGPPRPHVQPLFHAVTPFCRIALCGAEPGSRSFWAEPPSQSVTCPACLRRMARLQRRA